MQSAIDAPHRFCFTPEQIIAQANGCFLRYRGGLYLAGEQPEKSPGESGVDYLQAKFSELGALAIRYPIALRQRAALLCQLMQGNYEDAKVDSAAPGANQDSGQLFPDSAGFSATRRTSLVLVKAALATLGRGRVLNERGQALMALNTLGLGGELGAWDILHTLLWSVGTTLPQQLERQQFIYLPIPLGAAREDYERIAHELQDAPWELVQQQGECLRTASGRLLTLLAPTAIDNISIDEGGQTWQDNGLMLTMKDGTQGSAGWFVHRTRRKLVDARHSADLLRIILMARGGFHRLTPGQKCRLQKGLFADNGLATFIQNQTFNAMLVVLRILEGEYGFDAVPLLPPAFIRHTASRLRQTAANSFCEDFLVGALVTEMSQVLRRIQPGAHTRLPVPLSASFRELQNNARGIARAFGLTDASGAPLLQTPSSGPALSFDERLIDMRVAGELAPPAFTAGRHLAAVLAAALLISEQAIVAQLLRSACLQASDHADRHALQSILGEPQACEDLIDQARWMPATAQGPVLGLQYGCCDSLVENLRQLLGHDCLAELALKLHTGTAPGGMEEALRHSSRLRSALLRLAQTARILQENASTSVKDIESRGVCAGTEALLNRFAAQLTGQRDTEPLPFSLEQAR